MPMRAGWTVRAASPGWVSFGTPGSETEGGNLLRPTCVATAAGLPAPLPDDVVAWLLQRADLDADVVEDMQVDGRQGQLVTVGGDTLLWCTDPSSSGCFGSNRAYAVFPTPEGVIVVEGFGETPQRSIDNTRALAQTLTFD
ncbi:hypothetical protein OO014_06330 [Intrasporangium calvum]|uniref:Uncharacterized protein n=1 Tax=Intrasporangium calvum TaxID=53358 RepID=A0ABT5GG45_9MICO|nr:hypothetical protein [Intrasporangium calvum]MDC5696870.1 hypothetical protein [Intrasporangium calvum]